MKNAKNEKTYGRGSKSTVLKYTVVSKDNRGATKGEETVKVVVRGKDEFSLEKNRDEFCEKIEEKYAKKKNMELTFLHEEHAAF